MIGVVLWSNPSDHKAVIWCEDHGDLAFLSQPGETELTDGFVDVGDVVEFDLKHGPCTRRVENIRLINSAGGAQLVQDFKTKSTASRTTAQIIPFRLDRVKSNQAPQQTRQQM